jgi:hypothetical protein
MRANGTPPRMESLRRNSMGFPLFLLSRRYQTKKLAGRISADDLSFCPALSVFFSFSFFWGARRARVVCLLSGCATQGSRQRRPSTINHPWQHLLSIYNTEQNGESISSHRQISEEEEEAADRRYALYNAQPRGGRGIDGWQELSRRIGLNLKKKKKPTTHKRRNWCG